MSSFTETPGSFTKGNGPCNPPAMPGGSIKSYTQLIEAYENLTSMLAAHVASDLANEGANPHNGKGYVSAALEKKQNTLTFDSLPRNESGNPVTSEGIYNAIKAVADAKQELLTFDNTPAAGSINPVISAGIYNAIKDVKDNYQPRLLFTSIPSSTNKVVTKDTLEATVDAAVKPISISFDSFTSHFGKVSDIPVSGDKVAAVEYLLGKLNAQNVIDYTDWVTLSAQHAGLNTSATTQTSGAYILGMLSLDWGNETTETPTDDFKSKSARAYIKYINTFPLDAVVDMAVTKTADGYTGAITATVSHAPDSWKDLAFHLAEGTDSEGNKAVYLCISSSSFAYHPSEYPTIFRVCGENFIPATYTGYITPNNMNDAAQMPICSTACFNEVAATAVQNLAVTSLLANVIKAASGKAAINILEDGTIHILKNPKVGENGAELATTDDVNNIIPVGAVLRWPGNASAIPARYHICDGSTLPYSDNLAKLAEVLGMTEDEIVLPVEDCAIIRLY